MALTKATRIGGRVNYPYQINGLDALRSFNGVLNDGDLLSVSGYYLNSFEGGGLFRYAAGDTSTPDDGGFCIVDPQGRRFKRVDSTGVVVPSMFGCIPDGQYDAATGNCTGTDNTLRLQQMLNYAHNNGMEVYIPKGYKYLTGTLYLYYHATLNPLWVGNAGRLKITGGTTGPATGNIERQGAALLHKPGTTTPLLHLYGVFDIASPTGMGGYVQIHNMNFIGSKVAEHVILLEGSQGFMEFRNYTVKVMNTTASGNGITENTTWETIHDNGLIRGLATGDGTNFCTGLNVRSDGSGGQVNMKVYRNLDVYKCGYNFRIGRREKTQGTFGPLVFHGGQGSLADQHSAWLDGGVIAFTSEGWQHEGARKNAIRIDRRIESGNATDITRSIKIISTYITGCGLIEDGTQDSYAIHVEDGNGIEFDNLVFNNVGNGCSVNVGVADNVLFRRVTFRTVRAYGTASGYGFRAFGTQTAAARIRLEDVIFNQSPSIQFDTIINEVFSRAYAGGRVSHNSGTVASLSMGASTGQQPAHQLNVNLSAATTLTDIMCTKLFHTYIVTSSNSLLTIPNDRAKFFLNGSSYTPTSAVSVIALLYDGTRHIELYRSMNGTAPLRR